MLAIDSSTGVNRMVVVRGVMLAVDSGLRRSRAYLRLMSQDESDLLMPEDLMSHDEPCLLTPEEP